MRISEIKAKLTSEDSDVLRQSLTFVTEKLSIERARALKAETRATAMLAVAGILTGLIIPLTNHALNAINQNDGLILFALFSASVILLIKAALFLSRHFGPCVVKNCNLILHSIYKVYLVLML